MVMQLRGEQPRRADRLGPQGIDAVIRRHARSRARDRRHRRLCCVACGATITDEGERIDKRGAHRHTMRNPHGLVFQIGCFARAPGCAQSGPATDEHTWFPGYRWEVALCAHCGSHMGWRFARAGDDFFHGLICSHLRGSDEG